jgi:uncharacterized membrane protein
VQRRRWAVTADLLPRFVTLLVSAGLLMALAPDLSDIGNVRKRELFVAAGGVLGPNLPKAFEYPVLARVLYLGEKAVSASVFGITLVNVAVGLAGAVVVYLLLKRARADVAVWALAPTLLLAAQNLDAWTAAIVLATVLVWEAGNIAGTGVLGGVGLAFKLSPAVVLAPLAAASGWAKAAVIGAVAAAVWVVVNVPYYLYDSEAWKTPYRVASERDDTKGTIWAALPLHGRAVNVASLLLFAVVLGALCWAVGRRRIDPWSGASLTMIAFLATNKLWQPHYVLWLLPLLALSGTPRRPLRALELANLAYFVVLWGQMDFIDPTDQGFRISAEPWTTLTATARLVFAAWLALALWRQGVERAQIPDAGSARLA